MDTVCGILLQSAGLPVSRVFPARDGQAWAQTLKPISSRFVCFVGK